MITLTGLTQRQRLMAELLWTTNDREEVARYVRLDRDARTVYELIIAAELDQHMEVADEVVDYLSSL